MDSPTQPALLESLSLFLCPLFLFFFIKVFLGFLVTKCDTPFYRFRFSLLYMTSLGL